MDLGLVWRWKQSKQLDYAEDMRTYQIALDDGIMANKGGRRVLGTDRNSVYDRPHKPIWPGTITG
jgi:hypothetical protein